MIHWLGLSSIFFTAIFSGWVAYRLQIKSTYWIRISLGFSGAYLLSVCILHLLPEVFEVELKYLSFFVLGGFFIQLIIEYFSKGLEHGHIHGYHSHQQSKIYTIMIGVSLHGLIEGLPLSGTGFKSSETLQNMYLGIILHHIPSAFVLVTMLKNTHFPARKITFILVLTSLSVPMGAIIGKILLTQAMSVYFNYILAVVVGVFLHLSTTILFESAEPDHQYRFRKFVAVSLGILLACLISLIG
ncbi:MAG: ZIP family metal transporter [Bacteroidia bacterium]|nr:ZIP family metal transporter [Bacteroidia bacterium]MDW8347082.1 ZIP family metal transporter [Bacteroidia bacterium]